MSIDKRIVHDLGEYMNTITEIARVNMVRPLKPPILWFRGMSNIAYSLVPSVFRTDTRAKRLSQNINYTKLHYAEDIRTQHYIAKNYHLLASEPSSRVEWLEVMQHHQVNTRVLDWSESSIHSLLFALEVFFDNSRFNEEQRKTCVPCVWVLNPQKLNKKIVRELAQNKDMIGDLLKDLNIDLDEKNIIMENIEKYKDLKNYAETKETGHIDYIFNISSINDEIFRDRIRIKELLKTGEVLNPLYYFLARIYSDGYLLSKRKLPPLCVVHPYHSERIKAQKGVFSVFPFYEEQEEDDILRKNKINPDAFEHNLMAQDCLYQILIRNPQKIALQLMENGMNDSWLYPEMPIVSSEIENHKIF